jgi:hypothetical protein
MATSIILAVLWCSSSSASPACQHNIADIIDQYLYTSHETGHPYMEEEAQEF